MTSIGKAKLDGRSIGNQNGFLLRARSFSNESRLLRREPIIRRLLLVVIVDDARHIGARLAVGWNSVILRYALWPCVVSGQRFHRVVVELLQQLSQIAGAGFNI